MNDGRNLRLPKLLLRKRHRRGSVIDILNVSSLLLTSVVKQF